MYKYWQKIKKHHYLALLLALIFILTPIYFYLPAKYNDKFYSPDETANFFFAQNFAKLNSLKIPEPMNNYGANIVFPRSINVTSNQELVSGSFLGLPVIYGLLAKIFSTDFIVFFTPFLSLLTVLIFFLGLKNLLSEKTAFYSSLLVLLMPIFIYTANKGLLQHNLQLFFVVFCFYLLTVAQKKENDYWLIPASLFFSLALFVRTSEIFFFSLLIIAFWFNYDRKFRFLLFFGGFSFLGLIGILLFNQQIYGSFFSLGYQSLEATPKIKKSLITNITSIIFPFGLKLKIYFYHLREFLWKLFFPFFVPAMVGLIYLFKKNFNSPQKVACFSILTIAIIYETVFYGTFWPWGLSGISSEIQTSIGAPHLRYFLPLFFLFIPFVVIFFEKIIKNFSLREKKISLLLVFSFFLVFSVKNIFYDQAEGLLKISTDLHDFEQRIIVVEKIIPPNSLIIVPDWADRIFFPKYKVIQSINDPLIHAQNPLLFLPQIVDEHPVFYYTAENDTDFIEFQKQLNEIKLYPVFISKVFKDESLYEIKLHN